MIALTWILGIVSTLGVGGAVAAFIFFPTVAVPIIQKIITVLLGCRDCLIGAAFIAATLAAFWYGRHGQYERGHEAAVLEIAAEDAATVARAVTARNVWKECKSRSGAWDQTTGSCK